MRRYRGVMGSGEVSFFIRESLRNRVSLVATDEFVRFLWVRVRGIFLLPRDIYIVVCYFPPTYSSYAIHNGHNMDPFIYLYVGIIQYTVMGG
jgi:hypothetical protein